MPVPPQGAISESQWSYVQLDNFPLTRIAHKSAMLRPKARHSNRDWEVRPCSCYAVACGIWSNFFFKS